MKTARPRRAIFQHRAEIFVDIVNKKDDLGIDPVEIWKYDVGFPNNIYNILVILAQEVGKDLSSFKIFVVIGDDSAVPVMGEQIPVAESLPGGAGECFDRRQRQRYFPQ